MQRSKTRCVVVRLLDQLVAGEQSGEAKKLALIPAGNRTRQSVISVPAASRIAITILTARSAPSTCPSAQPDANDWPWAWRSIGNPCDKFPPRPGMFGSGKLYTLR